MNIEMYFLLAMVLALLALLLFSKKAREFISNETISTPHVSPVAPSRGIGLFPLVIGVVAICSLAGLLYLLVRLAMGLSDFSRFGWLIGIGVLALAVFIIDISLGFEKIEGESWKKRWQTKGRPQFYFAMLWLGVILLLNFILSYTDVEAWWVLWRYKGEGSFFFYLLMLTFTVSVWLMVNQKERKSLQWCGLCFFLIATFATLRITYDVTLLPLLSEKPRHGQVAEYIERIPVRKGETRKTRIDNLKKVIPATGTAEDVNFKYRVDNAQDWKTHVAGSEWKFERLDNLVEVTPIDTDLVVLEKRFVQR